MRETAEITDRLLFAVGIIVRRLGSRKRKVSGQHALEVAAVHLAMLDPAAIAAIERHECLRAGPQGHAVEAAYKVISAAIVDAETEVKGGRHDG